MYDRTSDLEAIQESFLGFQEDVITAEQLHTNMQDILLNAVTDAYDDGKGDGREEGYHDGYEEAQTWYLNERDKELENIIYEADGRRMEGQSAERVLAWVKERIKE